MILVQLVEMTQHFTTIRARRGHEKAWVEFHGDGYHQWTDDDGLQSDAQLLHDALEGWHSCVLHTGDTLALLERHPDYVAVDRMLTQADEGQPHA